MDEVKRTARERTHAANIPRVLGDFWTVKNEVKHVGEWGD
jgi:hypothetical protein